MAKNILRRSGKKNKRNFLAESRIRTISSHKPCDKTTDNIKPQNKLSRLGDYFLFYFLLFLPFIFFRWWWYFGLDHEQLLFFYFFSYFLAFFLFIHITISNGSSSIIWLLWDFSGLRLIWSKIFPNSINNKPKPSSFFLWFVGIYLTIFGIVSQRHENQINIVENKKNIFFSLLGNPNPKIRKYSLNILYDIKHFRCPMEPNVFSPGTVLFSFLRNQPYFYDKTFIVDIIESNKENLKNIRFHNLDIANIFLPDVNFEAADLAYGNYTEANLQNANFKNAFLQKSTFKNTKLQNANFQRASLYNSSFKNAFLQNTNFENAFLVEVDFEGAIFLNTNLKNARLHGAKLKNAINLKNAIFDTTEYDDETIFPDDFEPEKYGLINYSDFFRACYKNNFKLIKYLIGKGVRVNAYDHKNGVLPIHIACRNGNIQLVKYLLEKGASIDKGDKNGLDPLHIACNQGDFRLVKYLLENKAITRSPDYSGMTPRDIALQKGHHKIVELIDSFDQHLKQKKSHNPVNNNKVD